MSSKSHPSPQDSTGLSVLTQLPPQIALNSPLLASLITLPDHPLIAYSVFSPPSSGSLSDPLSLIEQARRTVLQGNESVPLLSSLLPSVHITRDTLALYVFAIGSQGNTSQSHSRLQELHFDGIHLTDTHSFTPAGVYPCSVGCSNQMVPCPNCLTPALPASANGASTPQGSSALHLPRHPLRRPYAQFLQAVRDRVIDDLTKSSPSTSSKELTKMVVRLKDGFLLGGIAASSEWGSGWDHYSRQRPLVHCRLRIYLSQSSQSSARLILRPILQPTHFLPLSPSLPMTPGTPINLLPHGIPAYFLNTYAGPTGALTAQFQTALVGLGAGDWVNIPQPMSPFPSSMKEYQGPHSPTYIIAWLSVQNRLGEDKGISIIWPTSLCLSYIPGTLILARASLKYIPQLPAQLQASPPPPVPHVPLSLLSSTSITTEQTANTLHHPSPSLPDSEPIARLQTPRPSLRPNTLNHSPTSESLKAFRTLTLSSSSRNMPNVASEVSGYVDAVAREREKERERIKREREHSARGSVSQIASPIKASPVPAMASKSPVESPTAIDAMTQPPTQDNGDLQQSMEVDSDHKEPEVDLFGDILPVANIEHPHSSQVAPDLSCNVPDSMHSASPLNVPQPPDLTASFDPFGGYNSAWSQPHNDFLDMNGYDMGFNMNMDAMDAGTGDAGNATNTFGIDEGFDIFTDDDFNFFDNPAAPNVVADTASISGPVPCNDNPCSSHPDLSSVTDGLPFTLSPSLMGDGLNLSGPGPPYTVLNQFHASPWASHTLGEGFTPHVDIIPPPPELLPPSPGLTPSSYSAPSTPSVHLSEPQDSSLCARRNSTQLSLGPSIFDPIPFAPRHRVADGKYAMGKFALLSPPEDLTYMKTMSDKPSPPTRLDSSISGWQQRYSAATDPRIGMVRRLAGVKRKRPIQGGRESRMSPTWVTEYEEWEDSSPQSEVVQGDIKSESEDDEELCVDEINDIQSVSRPITPLPPYLPLGPTLLQTHFHHSRLLPLSTLLRPPGSLVNNSPGTSGPISAPTPVSPAAVLGAASEKTKSLEAAAQILVREAVENSVWAESWRANAAAMLPRANPPPEIWQVDVARVRKLVGKLQGIQGSVDVQTLFGTDTGESGSSLSLQTMECPLLSVGKSDTIVQVLPTALRFWEKLGLYPRSGRKDVTAFVFFEGGTDDQEEQISQWLSILSKVYADRNFGTHSAGRASSCTRDGVVPVRFDTFRKTLASFVTSLPPIHNNLVLYIITPVPIINLTSHVLRQIFSAVKRMLKTHKDSQILFQFVPETLLTRGLDDPTIYNVTLDTFVQSVYDRILISVDRIMSRTFSTHSIKTRGYFQEPAFVLARPLESKVKLSRDAHTSTLDVVDRYSILHVGYQVTPCRKWLLAVCVDQRGEAHDLKAWLLPDDSTETFVVASVWAFALTMAQKANVEWRLVFSKLGALTETELDAWVSHLDAMVTVSHMSSLMKVMVYSAEYDSPWVLPAPEAPIASQQASPGRLSRIPPGSHFTDITSATYTLFSGVQLTASPHFPPDLCKDKPFIPDTEDGEPTDNLGMLPLITGILIRVPADADSTAISMLQLHLLHSIQFPNCSLELRDQDIHKEVMRNFYELTVLAKTRWKLKRNPVLPFHLAALEVMHMALDGGNTNQD